MRSKRISTNNNKKGGGSMLRVPSRGLPTMKLVYVFPDLEGQVEGAGFKWYLRDVLRRVPDYHRVIEVDVDGVDTLGKWLFGIPGYAGNARFIANPDEVPRVEVWCGGCSESVIYAIDKLFSFVGGVRVDK